MTYYLVCLVSYLYKLLQHTFIALRFIPCKRVNIFRSFPLVADGDDCSLLNDVIVRNIQLVTGLPEVSDIGRCLNIEVESFDFGHTLFYYSRYFVQKDIVQLLLRIKDMVTCVVRYDKVVLL